MVGEGDSVFGAGWGLLGWVKNRWVVYPGVSRLILSCVYGVVWQAACLLPGCVMVFVHICFV